MGSTRGVRLSAFGCAPPSRLEGRILMKRGFVLTVVALAAHGSFLASPAGAATYTFTNIADSTGPYTNTILTPVINNDGVVAFGAGLDTGGATVVKVSGPTTTTILDTASGPFTGFPTPGGINAGGAVVFTAQRDAGDSGI